MTRSGGQGFKKLPSKQHTITHTSTWKFQTLGQSYMLTCCNIWNSMKPIIICDTTYSHALNHHHSRRQSQQGVTQMTTGNKYAVLDTCSHRHTPCYTKQLGSQTLIHYNTVLLHISHHAQTHGIYNKACGIWGAQACLMHCLLCLTTPGQLICMLCKCTVSK